MKHRPKVKDLVKEYGNLGFFLSNDEILGQCVCVFETEKANKAIEKMRKRGLLCIHMPYGTWCILKKD